MSETSVQPPVQGQVIKTQKSSDPVATVLKATILFVIVFALCGVLYVMLSGITNPPAPRTALEAQYLVVQEAVKQSPKSGQVWADYVRTLTGMKRYNEAKKQVEAGRKTVRAADQRLLIDIANVELLLAQEKNEDAYKAVKQVEADQKKIVADTSKKMADEGIRVNPKLFGPEIVIKTDILKARASALTKRYDDAVAALTDALTYDPNAADVMALRGVAYYEKGDKAKATADWKKALTFDPENAMAQEGLQKVGEK